MGQNGIREGLTASLEDGVRDALKSAVQVELPWTAWQRCVVHVPPASAGRNVLAHVPQTESKISERLAHLA